MPAGTSRATVSTTASRCSRSRLYPSPVEPSGLTPVTPRSTSRSTSWLSAPWSTLPSLSTGVSRATITPSRAGTACLHFSHWHIHSTTSRKQNPASSSGAAGAFQVSRVWFGEAVPAVQVVGVGGVQGPAEAGTRAAVDHRRHQFLAKAGAPRVRQDKDVRQVAVAHSVRDRAGEPALATRGHLVHADDAPGGGQLRLEVLPRAGPAPVRLRGQEVPYGVPVDPAGIVVKLVGTGSEDHPRIVTTATVSAVVRAVTTLP